MGELASNAAQKQGLTGTVIYGSSRDVAGIKKLNYPVFSRDIIPNAGKPLDEGAVNITVNCGSTTINPGDFIMGDECGVVCVPKEITEEILREAYKIVDNEDHIVRQLDSGRSFLDILGFK